MASFLRRFRVAYREYRELWDCSIAVSLYWALRIALFPAGYFGPEVDICILCGLEDDLSQPVCPNCGSDG